ncbi:HNH endonuclease [Methylobacterium thuringiense]|uniref:HNH nuclease domain-containing protein n=1 Tax=Methylobacterium thuringiense TaxID=1003091 RepID=A0ABQ4TGL5_9HYPH|nr:HNH endonuclease signature motif containing protein [Methylobacterium thuringiense]GJE54535.1 hypothetical protein EKPJFOCH_1013 [Methylobacterium thuringiense]
MSRREFGKPIQRAALARAGFVCEGILDTGSRCLTQVGHGRPVEFDHILPDWMGGEPSLENCSPLCPPCHRAKTAQDAANRAKTKRQADAFDGVKDPHRQKLQGRGFRPSPPQRSATRRIEKFQGTIMERGR